MANNIFCGAKVVATGANAILKATESGGVYTLEAAADGTGDTALIFPGIVQAGAQNLAAPLMAKDNGDGTYSLVIASA